MKQNKTRTRRSRRRPSVATYRPERSLNSGSAKFSELTLSRGCADYVTSEARRRHLSKDQILADILERWIAAHRSDPEQPE